MKIEVEVLATVGDHVFVENYRTKSKRWEPGVVSQVEIGVNSEWKTVVGYTVTLNRKSYPKNGPSWGCPIRLYVRQDKIQLFE